MATLQKTSANQSQKLMVFVLTMALYGLATLLTELIPSFQVGIVEFSVEYFLFIPLTLAMLFDPMSAALGAATGELVFSEIMLGQFGGLGEVEKFITVSIGVYLAGRLVRNPRNRTVVGAAAFGGVVVQQVLGCIVDICKVQFGVQDFEAVEGLPQSVFATEGFACLNDILFSGILFCLLPTLYLVPKLYGAPHRDHRAAPDRRQNGAGLPGCLCRGDCVRDAGRKRAFSHRLGGGLGRQRDFDCRGAGCGGRSSRADCAGDAPQHPGPAEAGVTLCGRLRLNTCAIPTPARRPRRCGM